MGKRKTKEFFSKNEYQEIKKLVFQLENSDSSKQKTIRQKIRDVGLYWSELKLLGQPKKLPYTVANLEKMFEQGVLKLDDGKLLEIKVTPEIVSDTQKIRTNKGREQSDEHYVIDLCDEILGEKADRQHRFNFLRGDTGRKLPVDAYYKKFKLVVEYYEKQHSEYVPFFDKKDTVSGVPRGVQRKIYDQRRKDVLPEYGIKIIIISYKDFGVSKKLRREKEKDLLVVKQILINYITNK